MTKLFTGFCLTLMLLSFPLISTPVHAAASEDTRADFVAALRCQAIHMTLVDLHFGSISSLVTLSWGMLDTEASDRLVHGHLAGISKQVAGLNFAKQVLDDVIIPDAEASGISRPTIDANRKEILPTFMSKLNDQINSPQWSLQQKIAVKKLLLSESSACETAMQAIYERHTH